MQYANGAYYEEKPAEQEGTEPEYEVVEPLGTGGIEFLIHVQTFVKKSCSLLLKMESDFLRIFTGVEHLLEALKYEHPELLLCHG